MTTKVKLVLASMIIILAGSVTGYLLSTKFTPKVAGTTATSEMVRTSTEVGVKDQKTFRDSATGKLESGGINGEGTHKLVRDGGPSQTVYLLSSIVDLEEFVGKKIEVWGETIQAQKAGWLMDVGLVKLLE